MARFEIIPADALQQRFAALTEGVDRIALKMIDAATPYIVDAIKKKLEPHRDTGDLIRSVTAQKAKLRKTGGYRGKVGFKGYGLHIEKYKTVKVANTIKAAVLEYGTGERPAQPFLDAAVADANADVIDEMQDVFNREESKG